MNKVQKQILVDWKKLSWLQTEDLKDISEDNLEKLKDSIRKNGFIQPFNIWENAETKEQFILDGHHRKTAMFELIKEGEKIDELLPANIIDCKNRKEAIKFLLLYSSNYAIINKSNLYSFLEGEDISVASIMNEVSIQDIDLSEALKDYSQDFSEKNQEVDVSAFDAEMTMKFTFSEEKFLLVQSALENIDEVKETALLRVLGLDDEI